MGVVISVETEMTYCICLHPNLVLCLWQHFVWVVSIAMVFMIVFGMPCCDVLNSLFWYLCCSFQRLYLVTF